jgi:isopentenyl phosphate kinase
MDRIITPIIVKLGGSVITIKEKPFTPNLSVINRLAREIKRADRKSLIIIHGGGSYGHPLAREYNIIEGLKDQRQLIGFSKTRQAMMVLNKMIVDSLIQQNVPTISVQPSAFILTDQGRISEMNISLIERMLRINLIPLLYGDAVLDEKIGFSILSGDQIASNIAIKFKVNQIIICVDVDGLFNEDPKKNPKANIIEEIELDALKNSMNNLSRARTTDVTGGMFGKIVELIPAVESGIKVKIINAKKVNRLYKALKNEKVKGTEIKQG